MLCCLYYRSNLYITQLGIKRSICIYGSEKTKNISRHSTMLLPWCRFEILYSCPYKRVDCQKMKQKGLSDHQAQNVWNGHFLHDVSFLLHRFILKLTHKNNVEHIVLDLLAGPKFFKYLWMSFDQGFVIKKRMLL